MNKKIIVFFHIYNTDLIDEYLFYLNNIKQSNYNFDLYISICHEVVTENILLTLHNFHNNVFITECENRGADIGGFFSTLRNFDIDTRNYCACMYLHTKKSKQYGDSGIYWRRSLLNDTLISYKLVNFCVENITNNGIIASNKCITRIGRSFYDNEQSLYNSLCTILNIPETPNGYFVAGTIFWMNMKILDIIIKSSITCNNFDTKFAHSGLLEHGFERIFGTISEYLNLPVLGINLNITNKIYKLKFCPFKTDHMLYTTITINTDISLPNEDEIYIKYIIKKKFIHKY